ncbi:hypothetical protein ATO13_05440 [Stappia sp. 22II-S9-Z10]|nr:hypothetical protein ATO13_05440 [Stappia sp. 22II-S9-Z10]
MAKWRSESTWLAALLTVFVADVFALVLAVRQITAGGGFAFAEHGAISMDRAVTLFAAPFTVAAVAAFGVTYILMRRWQRGG